MESFDNKDKFQTRQETKVLKYDETADGFEATIGFKVTDKKAAYEKHSKMGCICYENHDMDLYFISDPDGYWLEILD